MLSLLSFVLILLTFQKKPQSFQFKNIYLCLKLLKDNICTFIFRLTSSDVFKKTLDLIKFYTFCKAGIILRKLLIEIWLISSPKVFVTTLYTWINDT